MNLKNGKILVNGSVVLDTILAKNFFGGTGANIAYGLGKLKTFPVLFSLAGNDFEKSSGEDFSSHLKKSGVDLRVHVDKKNKTANFSCVTNDKQEQIGTWSPNAYKKISKISLTKTLSKSELKKVTIAIFSPGTPESIYKHLRELKKITPTAFAIFDPGQMITFYSKKQLIDCFNLANLLILNETEYKQMKSILGKEPVIFFNKLNKIIIRTQDARGSVVFQNKKIIKIPAVHPKHVLDPTGAGDAYRVGLIFGLWQRKSLKESCILGAKIASKNIEYVGCQKYKITK